MDHKLLLEEILEKSKQSLARITQSEAAVQTVKSKIELVEKSLELSNKGDTPKKDLTKILAKISENDAVIRQIFEKIQLLEAGTKRVESVKDYDDESPENEESVSEDSKKVRKLALMDYNDLKLVDFLDTILGQKLKEFLATMSNPDVDDEVQLNEWWEYSKRKWTKNGREPKMMQAWYRMVSWWSGQFVMTWMTLTSEFMTNPFQLSLQEIVYKAALLRNLLNSMGLVVNSDTKFKWAEPFITLGKPNLGSEFKI